MHLEGAHRILNTRLSPVKPSTIGFFGFLASASPTSVRGADSARSKNALFTTGVTMVMPSPPRLEAAGVVEMVV